MTIGIDQHQKRVSPLPGATAFCQICQEPVIAKCGEIYTWHWAHKTDRDCDPWKEHETEWHRKWKSRFPFEWQEVAMSDEYGERHAADVKTDQGLVIEFQNSSISPSTIRIRKEFYGNMIWVINAESFKDNFRLGSVVKRKVRELEAEEQDPYVPIEEEFKEKLEELSKQIEEKEKLIKPLFENIKSRREKVDYFNSILSDVPAFSDKILRSWINGAYVEYGFNIIISGVESIHGCKIKNLKPSWKALQETLGKLERNLAGLKKLEVKEINGVSLQIVPYEYITKDNYRSATLITRDSVNTLFLQTKILKTDFEYHQLTYNFDQFVFAMDLTPKIRELELKIECTKTEMKGLEDFIPSIKDEIQNSFEARIREAIFEHEKHIEADDEKWNEHLIFKSDLQIKKGMLEMKMADDVERSKKEIVREIRAKKFDVMRKMKGRYFFNWKHERRSWQAASEPIFFDIGEEYLFKKVSDNMVIKIANQ